MPFTAGQKLRASDLNAMATYAVASNGTAQTTVSTTFVDSNLSVNFVAPPSGAVEIHIAADTWNTTGTQASEVDFRLSGASTRAAQAGSALRVFGSNGVRATITNIVTGLTAGGSYTLTVQYRATTSGTANIQNKGVLVKSLGI